MKRKYYEAYNDRYQQIHGLNLQWFDEKPSQIVMDTIQKHHITPSHKILELGCGEGRDAFLLMVAGYDLLATDISEAAIAYCRSEHPEFTEQFQILDCVEESLPIKFDFIYAVALVHMLVPDEDRNAFYRFIRNHLSPNGVALICTMGDGIFERQTDIRTAFDLQNRVHERSGKEVQIASTSCRMVSFETFREELGRNGLCTVSEGITSAPPDFPSLMYAVVKGE